MIEYARTLGASEEVLNWCNTTLKSAHAKLYRDAGGMEHIIDYLISDAAPARLRKMSYEQAKSNADKWMKANLKKGRGIVDTDSDIETVHDFLDGTKIVKLISKRSYEREGFFMRHCVAGYNPEKSTIYSYRDSANEPHATFEVSKNGKEIVQIKGKGNGAIHPKYIHPILVFLKIIGMNIRPNDMINLGYKHLDEKLEQIVSMFVDSKGKKAEIVTLYSEKYLVVG